MDFSGGSAKNEGVFISKSMMMHRLALCLFLTVSWLGLVSAAEEEKPQAYRKALLACREYASRKEINDALKVLDADDAQVIFELARYLDSEAPAARSFQGAYLSHDPITGELTEHQPTIGYVALMLIRWKIVALSPGRFHQIHVIDQTNVKEWIAARKHMTLREMQAEAAQEGIDQAKKYHQEHHDKWSLSDLQLYRENLHSIMLGKPPHFSSLLR